MRTWGLSLALFFGLGLGLIATLPTTAAEDATVKQVAKLVEQLGSASFADRELATRLLDQIGAPALPALKKAAQDGDAEVRRRAEDLIQKIEKRADNVKLLEAKKIHLVYKDTPVPEAVADFAKKTGYNIALLDPLKKLADRKITLDTGEVSFWEAFDQFCEKAGLVDAHARDINLPDAPPVPPRPGRPGRPVPVPLPNVVPPQPPAQQQQGANGGAGQAQAAAGVVVAAQQVQGAPGAAGQAGGGGQGGGAPGQAGGAGQPGQPGQGIAAPAIAPAPGGFGQPNQITLVDGKPQATPTSYSGAVRVRALPPNKQGPAPRRADEVLVMLQVSPEPRIQWQNLVKAEVKKAIDDQDKEMQALANENPNDPNNPGGVVIGPNGAVANIGFVGRPVMMGQGPHTLVPIRLKKGNSEAKMLKELEGVLTANVWAPAKPMITVDEVFKAKDKTIKGADGGSIKVNDITRDAKGNIIVKFELEVPANVLPAGQAGGGFGGIDFIPPGGPIQRLPIQIQPAPAPAPPAPQAPQAPNGLQFQQVQQAQPAQAQPVQVQVQGVQVQIAPAIDIAPFGGTAAGVTLVDEKGQEIKPIQSRSQFRQQNANVPVMEHILTFPPQQGDALKLVFSGSRSSTLEIPFKLKNVPLQ